MPKRTKTNLIEQPSQQEDELYAAVKGLKEFVEDKTQEKWFLHTGNLALDYIISMRVDGSGGYPGGSVVEIFGEPGTGKSLLLEKAAAQAQEIGVLPIIMDAENRWDDDFAAIHGVDPIRRKKFYPETVEEFATVSRKILNTGKKVLIILDSMAILSTEKEEEDVDSGEMKSDQGGKAKKIHQSMRVLKSSVKKTGSILLIANHVISNPGSYINKKITPGGGGIPFQANVRLELAKKHDPSMEIEGKERALGETFRATVTKNSVAPPFGVCSFRMYWRRGLNKYSGLIDIMVDQEIIERNGAWYSYGDIKFQSKDLEKTIIEHPEILSDSKWTNPYFME